MKPTLLIKFKPKILDINLIHFLVIYAKSVIVLRLREAETEMENSVTCEVKLASKCYQTNEICSNFVKRAKHSMRQFKDILETEFCSSQTECRKTLLILFQSVILSE